jgi:hypothetical protein
MRRRSLPGTVACAAALAAVAVPLTVTSPEAPAAAAAAKPPQVKQLVAFKSGRVVEKGVRASATRVRVEGRRCAVGAGTALASLVAARPGRIGLADYGSCTTRPRDAGGLYVRSIRSERARGLSGWVYKVGRRLATAGAADPAGAFGNGRLRAGRRVTWFYCRIRNASCQRTLGAAPEGEAGGATVTVRGYDDDGKGVPVAGATVSTGGAQAVTDAAGRATLALAPGAYRVRAHKRGLVPSFRERVIVP